PLTLSHPSIPHTFFLLTIRPPTRSTLFPYTTLFRSGGGQPGLWTTGQEKEHCAEIPANNEHFVMPLEQQRNRQKKSDEAHLDERDRKSTRLNSSHVAISYAVFCLKKKKKKNSGAEDT